MTGFVKTISQQIATQFPAIYREQGADLVAFLEAYYEFLETSDEYSLKLNRNQFEYRDVDTTLDSFIVFFKEKYMKGLPFVNTTENRFLLKHIVDFYRSKGSEQSLKLLIKILFDDEADIYYPESDILKVSHSKWFEPKYIEVTWTPKLNTLIDVQIMGSKSGAKAFVEDIVRQNINGKLIYIAYLSNVKGTFVKGDLISNGTDLQDAPKVIGSLSGIDITVGGVGYKRGDILSVVSEDGVLGKARVRDTLRATNKVTFKIIDGGYGYTLDANTQIFVSDTVAFVDNPSLSFNIYDPVSQVTGSGNANGIVIGQNTSAIGILSDVGSANFVTTVPLTTPYGTSTVTNVEDTGSGATFEIGNLTNKEIVSINTDALQSYLSTTINATAYGLPLSPTANVSSTLASALTYSNMEIGTIQLLSKVNPGASYFAYPYVYIDNEAIAVADKRDYSIHISGMVGYFLNGQIVTQSNGARGIVKSYDNVNQILYVRNLSYTYAFKSGLTITQASSSTTASADHVYEDATSTKMGENSIIETSVITGDGFISTVDIIDSGVGYVTGRNVTLVSATNDSVAEGVVSAESNGISAGRYVTTDGHLNSEKKIRDNDYYQEYSYEVISGIDVSRYEQVVKDVVHVAGTKFFGRVEKKGYLKNVATSESAIDKYIIEERLLTTTAGVSITTTSPVEGIAVNAEVKV